MSRRYSFSNDAIRTMSEEAVGWTVDIPHSAIVGAFPVRGDDGLLLVTPAKESAKGRGQPVFDAYHPALPTADGSCLAPCLISFKVSQENRNPRNAVLTTGKGDRHIVGILRAIREYGTEVPVVCYNHIDGDGWYRCVIDAGRLLRENTPVEASGKRGQIAVLSKASRPSGRDEMGNPRRIVYTSLRVNIGPATAAGYCTGWERVEAPVLPQSHPW